MIKCYPFTKTVQASAMRTCFRIAECSLSSTKTVQASTMKACFQIVERCLSSTKIQNLVSPLQVFREENIRESLLVHVL